MKTSLKAVLGALVLCIGLCAVQDSPQAAVPGKTDKGPAAGRSWATVSAGIDKIIDQKLASAKVPASPLSDDAEFIRRATLDITGRIPTAERTVAFLNDTDPDKRAKLIDELLADPKYGEHMGRIWYHRIVKPDDDNRFLISESFGDWLAERFNQNQGWNKLVADILTADGGRDKSPQTVFFLAQVSAKPPRPEPNRLASSTSRLFLGVQLQCCECHNHPFTTWKQTDFWGLAAFFGNVRAENSAKKAAKAGAVPAISEGGGKTKNADAGNGSIVIPDTKGKTVRAKFLEGPEPALGGQTQLRATLAAWVTSSNNPYFARAAANRTWAHFFGRGIVTPVDDMGTAGTAGVNPAAREAARSQASHPELLKLLTGELTACNFDLKHLIRCICNSKAYQRSSIALAENKKDEELYSRMPVKVMSPDVLYDSLAVALGHTIAGEKGKGLGKKKKGGSRDQFRSFFNPGDEDAPLDYGHGVPQALRLMNAGPLTDGSTLIQGLVKSAGSPEKVIEGLCLATLNRKPTPKELSKLTAHVAGVQDQAKGYADVLWVLLNSAEFVMNH